MEDNAVESSQLIESARLELVETSRLAGEAITALNDNNYSTARRLAREARKAAEIAANVITANSRRNNSLGLYPRIIEPDDDEE